MVASDVHGYVHLEDNSIIKQAGHGGRVWAACFSIFSAAVVLVVCLPEGSSPMSILAKAEDPAIQLDKTADDWKAAGNEHVKAGKHREAIEAYTKGLQVDPEHAMCLSNRAMCYHKMGRFEDCLDDAKRCIKVKPDFFKAYMRGAMALRDLKKPVEAYEMINAAPSNPEVAALRAEIKPLFEKADEERVAKMPYGPAKMKEEGNSLYKKSKFDQAIAKYTFIIDNFPKESDELLMQVRSNRAACNHQLSNFDRTIEDCSVVLEKDPDNVKALVRRMVALEAVEKYKRSLADARKILQFVPGHETANACMNRLKRHVPNWEQDVVR